MRMEQRDRLAVEDALNFFYDFCQDVKESTGIAVDASPADDADTLYKRLPWTGRFVLRAAKNNEAMISSEQRRQRLQAIVSDLHELDSKLANRSVNEGFSGGEKKRNEIFQMAMLEPKLSILDETDSGLDIDALRIVAEGVNKLKTPETSCIVITHYQRLLDYIKPDIVHVLYKGRIVKTAGPELALELEEKGYDWIKKELGEL